MRISDWSSDVCSSDLERGAEVGDQPAHARAVGFADRLVDVAVAGARQAQYVLGRLFLNDVDDVVDRDHADETPRLVDDGSRVPRIFPKATRNLFLIHVVRKSRLLGNVGSATVDTSGH